MNSSYISRVDGFLGSFLEKDGYRLIKTEFVKEDGNFYLRSYIELTDEEYRRRENALEEKKTEEADAVSSDSTDGPESETLLEPGIDINDCVKVSRKLSKWLDKEDFIQENYTLEVCSRGFLDNGQEKGEA